MTTDDQPMTKAAILDLLEHKPAAGLHATAVLMRREEDARWHAIADWHDRKAAYLAGRPQGSCTPPCLHGDCEDINGAVTLARAYLGGPSDV